MDDFVKITQSKDTITLNGLEDPLPGRIFVEHQDEKSSAPLPHLPASTEEPALPTKAPQPQLRPNPQPRKKPDVQKLASTPSTELTPEELRRAKSFLLYMYESKNKDQQYSPRILDMSNSLEEIKDELELVNAKRETRESIGFYRTGLVFLAQGAAAVQGRVDPNGPSMDDWARDINFDTMTKGKFDDLLAELAEKYRGVGNLPIEIKLAYAVGQSFALAYINKKAEATLAQKVNQMMGDNFARRRKASIPVSPPIPSHHQHPESPKREPPPEPEPPVFRPPPPDDTVAAGGSSEGDERKGRARKPRVTLTGTAAARKRKGKDKADEDKLDIESWT